MSFSDIEFRITKFLMEIAECERSIEITRRVLSDCIEYDPYQIFKLLDKERKNAISIENIMDFLFQKNINISVEEAKLILFFYDKDQDGLLSYDEFLDLIQSKKESDYKKVKKFAFCESGISYNIEFSLEKLFIKELKLAKDVLFSLKNMKSKSNFDIHSIFHYIKDSNAITIQSLRNFLEKNNVSFLESDLNFIYSRLDINKDGKIDFVEFHSLLGFPRCYYCCPCIICPYCGTRCCNECLMGTYGCIHHNLNAKCICPKNGNLSNNDRTNSPMKNIEEKVSNSLSLRLSPERKYAPFEVEICDNCNNIPCKCNYINSGIISNKRRDNCRRVNNYSPLRDNEEKISNSLSIRLSPERKYAPYEVEVETCNICNTFPCSCRNKSKIIMNKTDYNKYNNMLNMENNNNLNLNNDEINKFNFFLKMLMDGEKEIEQYKADLAIKKDFNCEDIFRLFEYKGRGFISPQDLKYGLGLLDIKVDDYMIQILMNRFDLKKKNQINYADFFDMIIPFQRSYRNFVETRIPLSNDPDKILNILDKNTISSLKILFVKIIEFEIRINDIRKKISSIKDRLFELYQLIDYNNIGYFEYSDFINYLKKYKIDFKQLSADLLFIRLDKNRRGRIYFEDLEEEFKIL